MTPSGAGADSDAGAVAVLARAAADPTVADPTPSYPPQLLPSGDQQLRFGKILWLLVFWHLLGGCLLLYGGINDLRAMGLFNTGRADFDGMAVAETVNGGCLLVSGLSLIVSSRRRGLVCAIAMMVLALLVNVICAGITLVAGMAPFTAGLSLPARAVMTLMGQGAVAAAGSLAYFLTTPRLLLLFPRRQPQDLTPHLTPHLMPPSPGTTRLASRLHQTWLILLIGLLLVPVGWLAHPLRILLPLLPRLGEEPTVRAELQRHLVEYGFAALCLLLVILLLVWRRWSSIRFTIIALWLVLPVSLAWYVSISRSIGVGISSDLSLYPSGFGFEWLGVMAWTAYLTQSPQVHRLYPGHRRYSELVTDVDVF